MDFSGLNRADMTLMGTGLCVLVTMHFTVQLVSQHLFYWKNPKEQKAILVIVLMAPIYTIVSFVGFLDIRGSKAFFTFLESIKECYEALVIAKFIALLYSYLNISISKNIVPDEIKGREIHHSFPMTLFQPHTVKLDHRTLKQLKYWTWQFVVIRPICSILMIVLQVLGIYPAWLSWTITIILNISVSLALYSLVVFYHVFAKELAPHKPLAKFMCIKGIVFFCFWQGIVLEILAAVGIIKSHHFWLDVEHIEGDLAIEKAKSFNFLYIYDDIRHSNILPTLSTCIRQAIYYGVENPLWFQNCNPRLRSLFLRARQQQLVPICKKFNSLRVLGFYCSLYSEEQSMLAETIAKLIHLRYLGLRCSYLDLSSSSFSKLWRLQTLDNWSVSPTHLPAEICKLHELRHLIGNFARGPLQIDNLTKLQTLKYVGVDCWRQIKTAKLVNLRELWIDGSSDGAFSFDSMSNLKSLRILSVQVNYYDRDISVASLQPLSHCQHLIELRLRGKLGELPTDIHKLLPNLQLLSLTDSRLKDDPMPLLEKLPYLTILHLGERFYDRKKIMCSDNGFLLLEILLFDERNFDIEWQVGKEALPRLRGLRIPENIKLTIPERLRSLPTPDPNEYTQMSLDEALHHR